MCSVDFNSSPILVKDIMSKALISVNLTTTAFQIANMMELGEIGAILVKENEAYVDIVYLCHEVKKLRIVL